MTFKNSHPSARGGPPAWWGSQRKTTCHVYQMVSKISAKHPKGAWSIYHLHISILVSGSFVNSYSVRRLVITHYLLTSYLARKTVCLLITTHYPTTSFLLTLPSATPQSLYLGEATILTLKRMLANSVLVETILPQRTTWRLATGHPKLVDKLYHLLYLLSLSFPFWFYPDSVYLMEPINPRDDGVRATRKAIHGVVNPH